MAMDLPPVTSAVLLISWACRSNIWDDLGIMCEWFACMYFLFTLECLTERGKQMLACILNGKLYHNMILSSIHDTVSYAITWL
jgi:hypothetical protein